MPAYMRERGKRELLRREPRRLLFPSGFVNGCTLKCSDWYCVQRASAAAPLDRPEALYF